MFGEKRSEDEGRGAWFNCREQTVFLAHLPEAGGAKEAEMEGCC